MKTVVVVEKDKTKSRAIPVEQFIQEYGITPKCMGDVFSVINVDHDGVPVITKFPNNACIYIDGRIMYAAYRGGVTIINGRMIPPYDMLEESQVLNDDEVSMVIREIDESRTGEVTLTIPNRR